MPDNVQNTHGDNPRARAKAQAHRNGYARAVIVAALYALFALALAAPLSAQQNDAARAANAGTGAVAKSAAELYEEAAGYTRRRYAELEREGFRYEPKLAAQVESEQRAVAARGVAQLKTRASLSPADKFHLGRLQSLAAQSDDAVATMRELLQTRDAATAEQSRAARFVVAYELARKNSLEEAEAALAGYLAAVPDAATAPHDERFRLEMELARASRARMEIGGAAEHARAAVDAAARLHAASKLDTATRDEIFYRSAQALSDSLVELKKTGEAIDVLQQLRLRAVSFPSADLYRRATLLLGRIVPAVGLLPAPGDPLLKLAPEIEVRDWIDQKPTTLARERGRVVLLDFWATWCAPCLAALPHMREWQRLYGKRGLTIIAFTHYETTENGRPAKSEREHDSLRNFRRARRLPFGFAVADTNETAGRYTVSTIPTAVLIDRRGRVRYLNVGSNEDDLRELGEMIEKLLDEPANEGGDN